MVILITGATGFIGDHLARALEHAGHEVVRAQRRARAMRARTIEVDFARDVTRERWLPRLAGVDVVVNAVGILRERGGQSMALLHAVAPRALFDACAAAGVKLVVQISALGADEHAASSYHRTKKDADDHLAALAIPAFIVQPSLVYGRGGTSARLFDTLASLPLIPLPGGGLQQVQPIHIDDVVAAVLAMVRTAGTERRGAERVALVGPAALAFRDFLLGLRCALGFGHGRTVRIPTALIAIGARLAQAFPHALLDPETLAMLERGNTASPAATARWLGRMPRAVAQFVAPDEAAAARTAARLGWLLPLLRVSIAVVWIATGIVSLGIYPVAESYALLARVGVGGALAPFMLYGAAVLDLALGIGVLVARNRRVLWLAQLAVIVGYTIIITWKLPEFWLHPYGPLLKNLPMLAAIWLLYEFEERP